MQKQVPQRALRTRGMQELDVSEDLGWGIAEYETENEVGLEVQVLECHTKQLLNLMCSCTSLK